MTDPLKTLVGAQWERIKAVHHHGIDLPLSALHSEKSCGIGEFYDLIPIIDWCQNIGMDVIQLLPLNDTGNDTCPFFALSALALNPLFLSLDRLEGVKEEDLKELRELNKTDRVAYHDVQSHKNLFFRTYFEKMGPTITKQKAYIDFLKKNDWVESYALFKVLKNTMSNNDWRSWPKELQQIDQKSKEQLIKDHYMEVTFYSFLQFLCFEQLTHVRSYANSKGVFLKGDIPILISPDSADVWLYADEFDLRLSAGSPPGPYNENGQVWGLPTFNWDIMQRRDYDWWKKRLTYASNFYDIYRIDHVLGFFRIFVIPQGKEPKDGIFLPADEQEWVPHGKKILSALANFTPMLPIAEDLGVVPDSIRNALTEMGIAGTRVIRWERKVDDGQHYIDLKDYNPISMTTVSTHDSSTLGQWWDHEDSKTYAEFKGLQHSSPLTQDQRRIILRDSHHSNSLFHINLLGEYLALFPELVWEDPNQERINVPGTVAPTNWTYRIRPSIEEIISHEALAKEMKELIL